MKSLSQENIERVILWSVLMLMLCVLYCKVTDNCFHFFSLN